MLRDPCSRLLSADFLHCVETVWYYRQNKNGASRCIYDGNFGAYGGHNLTRAIIAKWEHQLNCPRRHLWPAYFNKKTEWRGSPFSIRGENSCVSCLCGSMMKRLFYFRDTLKNSLFSKIHGYKLYVNRRIQFVQWLQSENNQKTAHKIPVSTTSQKKKKKTGQLEAPFSTGRKNGCMYVHLHESTVKTCFYFHEINHKNIDILTEPMATNRTWIGAFVRRYLVVVQNAKRKPRVPQLLVLVAPEKLESTQRVVLRKALVADHTERR